VNPRAVLHLVSLTTLVVGLAILACAPVSHLCGDARAVQFALLEAGGLAVGLSLVGAWLTRGEVRLARRDGFGVVTIGWLLAVVVGTLPYLLSGSIPAFVPALFESVSGFTTTGSTILADVETLPRGILFWRALTHWVGGMGVLVLCVALLPFLGVGGMQVFRAEVPGPFKDRLAPQIATTAKLLWGVYLLLTLLETILLKWVGGMGWFDAVCHAFSTIATGGFSTRNASLAAYDSAAIDIIATVFMFLGGVNFSLHHLALTRNPGCYFKDSEFRVYSLILLASGLFLAFNAWGWGAGGLPLGRCLRDGFFTGTSVMTTTGFCTADFDRWPDASRFVLVLLMFIGACAGSTGGGMKVVRVMVVVKSVLREIKVFMRPAAAITVKLGNKPVEPGTVSHIGAFFMLYVIVFAIASFLMTFFTGDLVTATSSVAASLGNVGPGLNAVGPTQNYAAIPHAGQAVLVACMLLGRLELYTVLMLFMPSLWKK
jgi:trk system potassium uptake protein TrkH